MSQGSEWQPSQQGLEQLVTMFRNANSHDSAIQQQIQLSIKEFQKNVPDFNNYLVFITVHGKNEQEYVRSIAGLVLKNNIISSFQLLPMEYQAYIRKQVLTCVGDQNSSVRKAIASIITSIVRKVGLVGWPELIPTLMHFLESQDGFLLDGTFQTLSVLCEDYAHEMDNEQLGRPLQVLIPKITLYFKHQNASIRKHAMNCINQFITAMPHALAVHMDQFLQGTFALASDSDPDVRRKVCQAFVMLTEVRIDYLVPHMNNVVQYMINATQEQNEDVALEACEFFAAIAESKACKPSLQAFLPQIVPVLLGRMVYSDDDPVLIQVEEDETVADSEKDIKPFFHRSNTKGNVGTPANPAQSADEEDDEDYDDDDDDEAGDWNIRKCAAAGIDILSLVFQEDILPLILQVVQARLNNTAEWKVRESAILVLGAISEGCYHGMKSYLPQLVPFLMTFLADNHPLIRSITCWTLSRYAHWIVGQENHDQYLKPLVFQLLPRVLDRNKKVQEAACSAFATLEEEAGSYLSPYLGDILQTLMTAFGKYQAKNLLILYDCLGTLADGVRRDLNKPEYINMIMPPLIQRWNALSDEDRNLLPLLECLTAIATALGVGFQQFAAPVYQRCMRLVETTLMREEACAREANNPELSHTDYPDLEFLVCSLDVISGIIDGLHTGAESLIANSNLIRSLLACCQSIRPDVRQSSFAMVGDLSKNCWIHLRPHVHEFLPLIINNIVKDYVQTCNNSVWAFGEITLRIGEEIKPYAMPALHKLVPILKLHTKQNLLENVAITIGRIGLVCPDVVSPFLEEFLESWCLILRDTSDDPEKDSAFRGLCKMIETNPNGAVKHFGFVCDAINSWRHPQTDLKENFNRILHGFKNSMGANWANYYSTFPPDLQKSLSAKYQL